MLTVGLTGTAALATDQGSFQNNGYRVFASRVVESGPNTSFTYRLEGRGPAEQILFASCGGALTVVSASGPNRQGPTSLQPAMDDSTGHTGVQFSPAPLGTYALTVEGNIPALDVVIKNGSGHRHFADCRKTVSQPRPASSSDTDRDGCSDAKEATLGTDPAVADSDGDGIGDCTEVNTTHTDPMDADSDDDGLSDGREARYGTDPDNPDTDGDGLTDGLEAHSSRTDPGMEDTDGDGKSDSAELDSGTDPRDAQS